MVALHQRVTDRTDGIPWNAVLALVALRAVAFHGHRVGAEVEGHALAFGPVMSTTRIRPEPSIAITSLAYASAATAW